MIARRGTLVLQTLFEHEKRELSNRHKFDTEALTGYSHFSSLQPSGTNTMAKIREALLGAGLLLVTTVASAGPASPGKGSTLAGYPECENAAQGMPKRVAAPVRSDGSAEGAIHDGASAAQNRTLDEYLSFHARVTEDNGKFTLMPWSGLRTHAN